MTEQTQQSNSKFNPKNAKVIALVAILVVVFIVGIVTVTVLATRRGSQSFSKGFTVSISGRECTITAYSGEDTTVRIPATIQGKKVSGIGERAFVDAKNIENIEFADGISVLDIAEGAFEGLTKLVYVQLPDADITIGKAAFRGCTQLSHMTMPAGVKEIGAEAFSGCTNLKYTGSEASDQFVLPANLQSIGEKAFYKCMALADVKVNDALTSVGESAFESSGLKYFRMGSGSKLTVLNDRVFYGANLLSTETTPFDFVNITNIGNETFAGMRTNFTYISVPKTVKAIGNEAFCDSKSLNKVVFAADADPIWGTGTFQGCNSLESVELPTTITKLTERMFAGCYRLLNKNDFTIGKNVTTIEDGALSLYYKQTSESRTSYYNKRIVVDTENTSFVVVNLAQYQQKSSGSDTVVNKDHSILMTADKKELVAYFGGFDSNSEYSSQVSSKGVFRLLEGETKFWDDIEKIRAYAFAGVRAKSIFVPPHVNTIGVYAFAGSDIEIVYFEGPNCTLAEETFDDMQAGLLVTTRGGVQGSISEFVYRKAKQGMDIAFGNNTL